MACPDPMMANASPAQVEADGILEYQYEPLITDDHVRLLILDPAASLGNPLRCSIVQYAYYAELCSDDNTRHQHFAAVSYTWGSSLPTHCKPLSSGNWRRRFDILEDYSHCGLAPTSPSKAPQSSPSVDRCRVSQSDGLERKGPTSPPNMGYIYRAAKKVHIWLGDDNADDARRVFSIVREAEIRNEWNPTSDQVTLMAKFFGMSWFTRRWIVQEAVLAHEAILQCGPNSIALSWLLRALKKAQSGTSGLNTLGYGPEMLLSSVGKYQEAPDGCSLLNLVYCGTCTSLSVRTTETVSLLSGVSHRPRAGRPFSSITRGPARCSGTALRILLKEGMCRHIH